MALTPGGPSVTGLTEAEAKEFHGIFLTSFIVFVVVAIMGEHGANRLLILSQVVLSVQLGFAVLPLVLFTSDRRIMGAFVNPRWVSVAGYVLTAAIVLVNGWLIVQSL